MIRQRCVTYYPVVYTTWWYDSIGTEKLVRQLCDIEVLMTDGGLEVIGIVEFGSGGRI